MNNYSLIILEGYVGSVNETVPTQNSQVRSLSIAVSDFQKNVSFYDCNLWGKQCGLIETLHIGKGSRLLIVGEPSNKEFTDKNGSKRKRFQVRVEKLTILNTKNSGNYSNQHNQDPNEEKLGYQMNDDNFDPFQ